MQQETSDKHRHFACGSESAVLQNDVLEQKGQMSCSLRDSTHLQGQCSAAAADSRKAATPVKKNIYFSLCLCT